MTYREIKVTGQRFKIGRAVITQRALVHCEDNGIDYLALLIRHATGDFGRVGHIDTVKLSRAEKHHGAYATDEGIRLTTLAILNRDGMVLSIYEEPITANTKIWIQTMLAGTETYTTVMLPSDY